MEFVQCNIECGVLKGSEKFTNMSREVAGSIARQLASFSKVSVEEATPLLKAIQASELMEGDKALCCDAISKKRHRRDARVIPNVGSAVVLGQCRERPPISPRPHVREIVIR